MNEFLNELSNGNEHAKRAVKYLGHAFNHASVLVEKIEECCDPAVSMFSCLSESCNELVRYSEQGTGEVKS